MKKFFLSLVFILLGMTLLMTIYLFATGEIRFYETFRMGGEVSGYFGKKSTLLEDEEHLDQVFQELSEEFVGQSVYFTLLNVSNNAILAIVEDPNQTSYYDYYRYDGTRFFPRWEKERPYKNSDSVDRLEVSEVPVDGLIEFYRKISNYLEEGKYELDKKRPIQISVRFDKFVDDGLLSSNVSGERQDFKFEADFEGNNFTGETN
jgi:hypothetical protein